MTQGAKKALSQKGPDPYKLEVAERIYTAFTEAGRKRKRGNELTQDELGRSVAKELGRSLPFPQGTVSAWMSATNPSLPDPLIIRAIGKVLNVDVMWLLYGAAED